MNHRTDLKKSIFRLSLKVEFQLFRDFQKNCSHLGMEEDLC